MEREAATGRYAALNAAHQCLREHGTRLLHLLELELGAAPASVQSIPPETMDLFAEIGRACRDTDRLLAAKAGAAAPLLQARYLRKAWSGPKSRRGCWGESNCGARDFWQNRKA